jgi:hypothetical protein
MDMLKEGAVELKEGAVFTVDLIVKEKEAYDLK